MEWINSVTGTSNCEQKKPSFSLVRYLSVSLFLVCFCGLITNPSAPGLIFGCLLSILIIIRTYLKNKHAKNKTLIQGVVLILSIHIFLLSTLVFDFFNLCNSEALSDSGVGLIVGTLVSFILLCSHFFHKKYRYDKSTVTFLIALAFVCHLARLCFAMITILIFFRFLTMKPDS